MVLRLTSSAVLTGALLAACGASQPQLPVAQRVCDRAQAAARRLLGAATTLLITDRDPADIVCLVRGGGLAAVLEAQASPQAWTQYDTVVVHLAQAFSGLSSGRAYMPREVFGAGPQAIWVPRERQLVATNGTQTRGGSYLTVTIKGRRSGAGSASSDLTLARAMAHAALPIAPRGPATPAPS
jgi:hypothetical protein